MSVLIGLHIKRVLANVEAVTRMVGNRIYPLVVPQGVETYPFICYDMNGFSGDSTKDGVLDDVASVNIAIIAKSYEEAIVLGNEVRYAFEGKRAKYEELSVRDCVNVAYNDEYIDALDCYAINLSMDFRTEDY